MHRHVLNHIWESGWSSTQKLVAIALADPINDEDGKSFLGLTALTQRTGLSPRAIRYAVVELEKLGFIEVKRRWQASNLYRLGGTICQALVADNPGKRCRKPRHQVQTNLLKRESLKENPSAAPSAFTADARRMLEAMTADNKPAYCDQDYLKAAANGDAEAWRSFRGSINQQTKHFLRSIT